MRLRSLSVSVLTAVALVPVCSVPASYAADSTTTTAVRAAALGDKTWKNSTTKRRRTFGPVAPVAPTAPSAPRTAPTTTASYADQVLALTTADLMPLVEQRVGKDVNELLKAYRKNSACACFPWADNNWDGVSDVSSVYGNVPLATALPEAWGSGGIPAMTSYLTQNNWWRVLYYAVGNRITAVPPDAMTINLNGGGWDTSTILITPGPAGNTRPSTDWSHYIADTTNRDNDRHFISPTSTQYARNRLFSIPYPFP